MANYDFDRYYDEKTWTAARDPSLLVDTEHEFTYAFGHNFGGMNSHHPFIAQGSNLIVAAEYAGDAANFKHTEPTSPTTYHAHSITTSRRSSVYSQTSPPSATNEFWTLDDTSLNASPSVAARFPEQSPYQMSPKVGVVKRSTWPLNNGHHLRDNRQNQASTSAACTPSSCEAEHAHTLNDVKGNLHDIESGSKDSTFAACRCGQHFTGKYALVNLKRHVRVKLQLQLRGKLACRLCPESFTQDYNQHKHCLKCHPTEPCCHCHKVAPFRCEICGMGFMKRDDLEKHMARRHPLGV